MPDIDDNYTPDFATPEQIASNRAYAKALLQQSLQTGTGTSGNVTAVSPWGGAAQLMQALVGGHNMNVAGDQERGSMANAASNFTNLTPPGSPITPPGAPAQPTGGSYPISSYAADTASQETPGEKNPYTAIGPKTSDGDNAYGKYQVKGSNIPTWTKEVLGTALTPQQYLANSDAQDAVYKQKFGQLVQQYGPEGAARAWYGGPGNVNNPNARDLAHPNAPTVGQYGQKFMSNLPQGGQALGFSGQPAGDSPQPAGSPSAMALALRGAPPMQPPGPGMGLPSTAPTQGQQTAQNVIPQGMTPQRQKITQQQATAILASPYSTPEMKKYAADSYFGQNQPIQMQGAFGSTVLIDPNTHQQTVIPGEGHWGTQKTGPIEEPVYQAPIPPGYRGPTPSMFSSAGGGGPGTTAAQPPASAPGAASAIKPPPLIDPPTAGKATPFAEESPPAPEQEMPDIISKGPEATGGKEEAPGMLGAAPPSGPLSFGSEVPGAAAPPTGGTKVAQNVDFNSMTLPQKFNWAQQQEINQKKQEAFNSKDADTYFDNLKSIQGTGTTAQTQETQLELAQKIINDPRFIQGAFADPRIAWNNVVSALGGKDATDSKTLNDAFEKLKSGTILTDMKGKLEGLGQVRNAEIELLKTASSAAGNTLGANRSIVEVGLRFQKQAQELAKIANMYDQGVRWDSKGQPLVDADGNAILSQGDRSAAGLNSTVNTYLSNHKLFSPEEIKNYTKSLTEDNVPVNKPRPVLPAGAVPIQKGQ